MSDSQTQSFQPTPSTGSPKRRGGLVIGLLVVLVAAAALAAAVWYAGGTAALGQLGGLLTSFVATPSSTAPSVKPTAPAAAVVTTASPSALPAEAQQRMFSEQVASHEALAALVGGQIVSLQTGEARVEEASATVPLTATFKDGSTVSGTLSLKRFGDTWYFFNITKGSSDAPGATTPPPVGFDEKIVETITQQQAQAGTQELLTKGLVDGGYRTVKVEGVTMGPRTATVDVSMSGGTEPPVKGRLVCISKTDGAITYWFVARFEKR